MSVEQLHTITVPHPPYETGRAITCVSVADFDTLEPLDYREFRPPETALRDLQMTGVGITKHILRAREQVLAPAIPIPNINEVVRFAGSIGLKPIGKISQVEELTLFSKKIDSPGITSPFHRQSFVIASNVDKIFNEGHQAKGMSGPASLSKELFIDSAALHELVHLSGIPDLIFFIVDRTDPTKILNVVHAPPSLASIKPPVGDFTPDKGDYFEEGFGTLCAYMYLWKKLPHIAASSDAELRHAGNTTVELPQRHAFYTNKYAYMAWGIERLTDFSPGVWDTIQQSRVYGASPSLIRTKLKKEIDIIHPRLFGEIDAIDTSDLEAVMVISSIIDELVHRRTGR